jgi:hypothetical protein
VSRRGSFSRWVAVLVLALAALLAPAARAEPTEADRASARSLASEGYDALERKDYATAVDRFRHADALVHAPTIGVDLARALIGLGRYVEAYERYELVIREGIPKGSPASWKKALDDAQNEVTTLEPRLGWLVIHVMGPLDPQVTIDGVEMPEAAIGARRAADPGTRSVRASAPGFEPRTERVTVKEGEEQVVTLVLDRAESTHEAEAPPPAPAQSPQTQRRASQLPAWVAFGIGGAGLVVGSVTGVLALGARSNLADRCPSGTCKPADNSEAHSLRSDLSRYHAFGTVSGVGFVVGIAGAATGAVLLITGSRESAPESARLWPVVGPGDVGVAGRF